MSRTRRLFVAGAGARLAMPATASAASAIRWHAELTVSTIDVMPQLF